MNEQQNPTNKNSLEDMKNSIKSLLGVKRNKESAPVSEKNSSSEIKKDLILKEEESNKNTEINEIKKQTIIKKKNDNYIDLTLDENNQANLNVSQENDLNDNNLEEKEEIKLLKDDNINQFEKVDKIENNESNEEKFQKQKNIQSEITIAITPVGIEKNPQIDLEIEVLPKLLSKEAFNIQENFELKEKKEAINFVNNINEIKSIQDEKIIKKENHVNNLKDDKDNTKTESILVQQQFENHIQASEVNQKEDNNKTEIPAAQQLIFNLFNVKNLSMPQEDLINIFKAPEKNIFENLNMKRINFLADKPLSAEKKERIGFSLDMVHGLVNQEEKIIKNFTKPAEDKDPFGLGLENTNINLFFNHKNANADNNHNQADNNINSLNENKPILKLIDNRLLQEINPFVEINQNQISVEAKIENKISDSNKNNNLAEIIQSNFPLPNPNLNTNISEINKNSGAPSEQIVVPMEIEKTFEITEKKEELKNENSQKLDLIKSNEIEPTKQISAPIEKKIILTSKIDQIINKKLEHTAINANVEKVTLDVNITQKQSAITLENINKSENKEAVNTHNEVKKELIIHVPKIVNNANFNSKTTNSNIDINNIVPHVNSAESKEQQVIQEVKKAIIIEEKTTTTLQPTNPNLTNENKSEAQIQIKKIGENNSSEKESTEQKETKPQLILKPNIPEKHLEPKPIEAERKDSTISVISMLKETVNSEQDANKPENQQISTPQAPKQAAAPEPGKKRAITFQEAKEQIDKFSDLISNLENEMKDKYGITIPQFYYEDLLPEPVKIKLVEDFFNDKEIVELGKQLHQKLEEKK